MVTQWSEPKENCLKFQDINVHEGFSDSKVATCGSIFEKSFPACFYASVVIVNEGFPILIALNDSRILFSHQIISCLPCESIEVFLSKLPLLIFRAFVFRHSRSQQWSCPYFMAWKLLANLLNSLETSLMETDSFSNTSWQRLKTFFFFLVVNFTVIVTELIINPKYSIFWDGTKADFSGWTTKPRLPKSLTHFHTFLRHISNEYAICFNF